ncbi:MAG: DUF5711 family protein [Blautia sp.]|nr:DUF5711 family protein [Blautia sp.]
MANFINKMRKKRRKQKNRKEKAQQAAGNKRQTAKTGSNTAAGVSVRLSRRQRKMLRKGVISAAAVVAVAFLVVFYIEKHTYNDYKILHTSEQEDIISTKYTEMDGKILRYSPEGVSLVNKNLEVLWNVTYSMENPVADVNDGWAVIADRDGTSMEIMDKEGITGSVTTSYTIVKAKVSSQGLVAAILDNGDETWINFYGSDGSLIAENQTTMEDPGYPMDVAISDNGLIMMVAYQFVDGGDTTSYVAFYNFGDVGQTEDDRIVSGYEYEGVVVPQVIYFDGSQSVAVRDDGLTLYKGKQIPKEEKNIEVEKEIVSTFYDDETIGLVFKNDDKEKQYTMQVYSTSGKLKFTKNFNIPYTTIKISDGNIIMYNSSQICVMSENGKEKYMGSIDGTVNDFFKIGWNKYLLVMDTGVHVIKLR